MDMAAFSCLIPCRSVSVGNEGQASEDCDYVDVINSDINLSLQKSLEVAASLKTPKQLSAIPGQCCSYTKKIPEKNANDSAPSEPRFIRVALTRQSRSLGLTLQQRRMPSLSSAPPNDIVLPEEGQHVLQVHALEDHIPSSLEKGDLIVKVLKVNDMETSKLSASSLQMLEWMRVASTVEVLAFKERPKKVQVM
eukprot:TRINITY_DN18876_c0_g1_i1.p1 TRINITY_DN18876_c0_g1~~TRINITY_DN18876_c0_g1_i1.p1  ORF type:complete len:202 (+),score=29.93 TRINITY_DN18876_c0_g1_i1:25-606(+)